MSQSLVGVKGWAGGGVVNASAHLATGGRAAEAPALHQPRSGGRPQGRPIPSLRTLSHLCLYYKVSRGHVGCDVSMGGRWGEGGESRGRGSRGRPWPHSGREVPRQPRGLGEAGGFSRRLRPSSSGAP